MTAYAKLLDGMMDAILARDTSSAPALLRDKQDFSAQAQLAVYTEGYRLRLFGAIKSTYPALLNYLGRAEFAALADAFITRHPSRHFNLDKYTIAFGTYVAQDTKDDFSRDLALLESAIHEVYQGEETAAIDVAWLQAQSPDTLATAPLLPRAASRLLAFDSDADGYFSAFREDMQPEKPVKAKHWLMVLRHKHQVKRLRLEEAEYTLLALLASGLNFGEALEAAPMETCTARDDFAASLQSWLPRWVNEGILRQPV